jgi:hypothetical protein
MDTLVVVSGCDKTSIEVSQRLRYIFASLQVLRWGRRPMYCASRVVSNISRGKKHIEIARRLSRGVSTPSTMFSKYWPFPLNVNQVREGSVRVDEDVGRLSNLLRGRCWKRSMSDSSFVNVERQVTISSAEMYLESGISSNSRWTRSTADKSSFSNPGNKRFSS